MQQQQQQQQEEEDPKWECVHCHSVMDKTNFTVISEATTARTATRKQR
jgi:hypothetical protein